MKMTCIAVIGSGPVGLATADRLEKKGYSVVLVCPAMHTGNPEQGFQMRPTFPAAAAFWTPFASGVEPAREFELSKKTLDFYEQFRNPNGEDVSENTGIVWRKIEQYWLEGTLCEIPDWSKHGKIEFSRRPLGDSFQEHYLESGDQLRLRCEFSYTAPVINVDSFLSWYREELGNRNKVELVEDWSFPLTGDFADEGVQQAISEWSKLIEDKEICAIVLCTGIGTAYCDIAEGSLFPVGTYSFKKGVVARIPAMDVDSEANVLLYEGGVFDRDSLYFVPHLDSYILGGTIHPVGNGYSPSDWQVSREEQAGILERAQCFLPEQYKEYLNDARLWDPGNSEIEWRAAVRPVLQNHGPYQGKSEKMTRKISQQVQRDIPVFLHFGHGGSGFTFCHDTAQEIVDKIQALGTFD